MHAGAAVSWYYHAAGSVCRTGKVLEQGNGVSIQPGGLGADDPSYGQCAITATLVHDMFGGTIHKIKVNGGGTHYFNKINGQYVDLTREQFDLYDLPVNYEPNQEISREYCARIHTNVTNSCSEISYNI